MSNIPSDLKYLKSHEWLSIDDDGIATVGVSHHAQELLGDLVFVELPEIGTILNASDDAGVVESVKAASDIYAPVSGEIVEVNQALSDTPELINNDPYGVGWIFKMQPSDDGELNQLLDADEYKALIESEE